MLIRISATLLPLLLATSTVASADDRKSADRWRVAVFNIWELSADKIEASSPQLTAAAEVLQRVRPDIVLINEIDFDAEGRIATDFHDRFLAVAQAPDLTALSYPHRLVEPVNTGVQSGFDFDGNGETGDPEDAWGFGRYPGQYGMALFSRWPIDRDAFRSFRNVPWRSMPGHLMPDGREGRPEWYSADEAAAFRLSSKSHWDVPVQLGDGRVLHLLASHPTPPVFDGDEDRNGRRNFDEIRLWADYLTGGDAASYLVDDQGGRGGLDEAAHFVVLGDLNADPVRGDAPYGQPAIAQLLDHPRIQDPVPRCPGPRQAEVRDGKAYTGDARSLTSGFGRIDYVLPSAGLTVLDSGVYWPAADDPNRRLVEGDQRASDHQLVWIDLAWPNATDAPTTAAEALPTPD